MTLKKDLKKKGENDFDHMVKLGLELLGYTADGTNGALYYAPDVGAHVAPIIPISGDDAPTSIYKCDSYECLSRLNIVSNMAQLSKMTSTRDIPPQFLKSAMMVGNIPFTALQKDHRVSYTLYIPPQHYNPDPSRQASQDSGDLHPQYLLPSLPLIVNVHGTGRNAERCRDRLIAFCDSERVAVLAPLFPAGVNGPADLDGYKLLTSQTLRFDLALLHILDEVATKWPGIDTKKFFLAGFSGGGQFAHRFAYLHPERVLALSVGAPGRATFLDKSLKWPNGIQDVGNVFDPQLVIDKTNFGQIEEIQLVIGGEDNDIYGGNEFWEWLTMMRKKQRKAELESESKKSEKTQAGTLAPQKKGRLDNLRELQIAWKSDGISSRLDVVPGIAHDALGVQPTVNDFLLPLVRNLWDQRSGPLAVS